MIEVVLQTPISLRVEDRLLGSGQPLHAPHLIDVEVVSVMRRLAARAEVTAMRAGEALADFSDFPLTRWPHDLLLPRVWELRHTLTAYDAVYVALAEVLGAALVTRDGRLAASFGHSAVIELL